MAIVVPLIPRTMNARNKRDRDIERLLFVMVMIKISSGRLSQMYASANFVVVGIKKAPDHRSSVLPIERAKYV